MTEAGFIPAADAASIPTEQSDIPAANRHEAWAQAVGKDPRLIGFVSDDQAASIVCKLHGHAAVETGFMGEWGCDRCGAVVGDSLMGCHVPSVIRDHDCDVCRKGWGEAGFWARFGVEPDGTGFLQQDRVEKSA